jgi:hypothetical protein
LAKDQNPGYVEPMAGGYMTGARIAALVLAFVLTVTSAPADDASPEGDREYEATCASIASVIAGIRPDAYGWSPITFVSEKVVAINVDDPTMVTVICPSAPRVACMEVYNPAKKVGDMVLMEGRVRYRDGKMILLDPCHSVPADEPR